MLKINLLPPYIYEGKTRKVWVGAWVLALALVVVGMILWQNSINAEAKHWDDEKAAKTANADLADKLKKDADAINAESAGIRAKNDFVNNAKQHNIAAYPPVYKNVTDYTISRVVYSAITPAQNQVNITAIAPTLKDVGSYVMMMEHNDKITNVNINIADIPGFGAGAGQAQGGGQSAAGGPPTSWHPFTVALTLAQPIPGAPSFGGAGGGGGGGAGGPGSGGPSPMPGPGTGAGPGRKQLPGAGA